MRVKEMKFNKGTKSRFERDRWKLKKRQSKQVKFNYYGYGCKKQKLYVRSTEEDCGYKRV